MANRKWGRWALRPPRKSHCQPRSAALCRKAATTGLPFPTLTGTLVAANAALRPTPRKGANQRGSASPRSLNSQARFSRWIRLTVQLRGMADHVATRPPGADGLSPRRPLGAPAVAPGADHRAVDWLDVPERVGLAKELLTPWMGGLRGDRALRQLARCSATPHEKPTWSHDPATRRRWRSGRRPADNAAATWPRGAGRPPYLFHGAITRGNACRGWKKGTRL